MCTQNRVRAVTPSARYTHRIFRPNHFFDIYICTQKSKKKVIFSCHPITDNGNSIPALINKIYTYATAVRLYWPCQCRLNRGEGQQWIRNNALQFVSIHICITLLFFSPIPFPLPEYFVCYLFSTIRTINDTRSYKRYTRINNEKIYRGMSRKSILFLFRGRRSTAR